MFWLLRFRGERLRDTLALWVNAIVWQVRKWLYRIFHPSATKQDFVRYIISQKLHLHWTNYPFNLKAMYYYDGQLRLLPFLVRRILNFVPLSPPKAK
jgi:hypothetical protein